MQNRNGSIGVNLKAKRKIDLLFCTKDYTHMTQRINVANQVQFTVAEVVPASAPLPQVSLMEMLGKTLQLPFLVCPKAKVLVAKAADFHPLIAAAALAFKQHYPLILGPDAIWLTVLQGVAQHIRNHSEVLRTRLVQHQTKIELFIETDLTGMPVNDSEMCALTNLFLGQIRQHLVANKRSLLTAEFSTTTDVERIAQSVIVMDAFQPYFDYIFGCICGIPSVILEGVPADWELLRSKVHAIHESDLELKWWTKHLLPLCDQFVRAVKGDVDREHWENLCKLKEKYGFDDLNGWLLKFIPYVRKDQNEHPRHRNPVLELKVQDQEQDDSYESKFKVTGCTSKMLPSGASSVPVTCKNVITGQERKIQFVGGLFGVSQSSHELGLRPEIGWAIAEQSRIDTLIDKLRMEHGCNPPKRVETDELVRKFNEYLPGDVWRFYTEIETVSLDFPANQWGEQHCTIYPLASLIPVWNRSSVMQELQLQQKQGQITANELAELREACYTYGHFIRVGEASAHNTLAWYVLGHLSDCEAMIFRWTGERSADSFIPVAKSFTDWLASLLQHASP